MHALSFHQFRSIALLLTALAVLSTALRADDFSSYEVDPAATFFLPQGSPDPENRGPTMFDNLADGRLLLLSTGLPDPFGSSGVPELYVETAVGSRTWTSLGALNLPGGGSWPSFGGAFLSVSPDGSRVAVGDNSLGTQHVGVFSTATLLSSGAPATSVNWYTAPHALGRWFDNRQLALSTFGKVTMLDTDSPVAAPVNKDLITGIDGASSDVGFDNEGNLYTGNGFDTGPGGTTTGDVRAFAKDGPGGWQNALATSTPLNFLTSGSFFYHALSATSIEFDNEGNAFIGGSDFFGPSGDANYLALRQNPANGSGERTFDPDAVGFSFYGLVYNEVTGELYANQPFPLTDPIDNTAVYVITPVPEPSSIVLCLCGVAGLLVWRRKRSSG